MKKIGILTSGGDCQGLNTAIRAVCKSIYKYFGEENVEIYGFLNGYKGLIKGEYQTIRPRDISGIINIGGTILGTARQPFKKIRTIEDDNINKVQSMKDTYIRLGLDCAVVIGGNGTQKTANQLSMEGLNIISLPKTIDNDIWGTDITFGFQSAVDRATDFIDCIHTTANSHGRIFIVELMGHKVGWLALHAGIASGADVILIPEILYNINSIINVIEQRKKEGKNFSIIAVAEGAHEEGYCENEDDKSLDFNAENFCSAVSQKLAKNLEKFTDQEIKVSVPGHFQRGGPPCPYDRLLATRLGAAAVDLIIEQNYGKMVALKNGFITFVNLDEIAGKLKAVPQNSDIIKGAREIGIGFGD